MGTWDQLTAGQGTAVVWASTSTTFAVLYAPHAMVPEFSGRFSRKKAKAREEEFMRQSAIAAAAANAEQAVCVQVCDHPCALIDHERRIACVTHASVQSPTPHFCTSRCVSWLSELCGEMLRCTKWCCA